jgi:CubicO group peptidase (beta-lactamase class C family)
MSKIRSPFLIKALFKTPAWLIPKRIRPVINLINKSDFKKAFFNTETEKNSVNSEEWKKAEIPAANGYGSAKGISKFYSSLIDDSGEPILSKKTLDYATQFHSSGPDTVLLNLPIKFGLGFMMENPYSPLGQNPDLFGHSGVGGSVGFADRKRKIGFGFTKNYMHPPGKLFKSANDLTNLFYSVL